jgi:FkbM family methyltransferase
MDARQLAGKVRWRAKDAIGRTVGLRLRADGIRAKGYGASDAYVFDEIFGAEDSYRRHVLVPLMRGGTVVEIGAHKGYFTVLAASVADKVVVFEPDDVNFAALQKNVALNGGDNVTAVPKAVSASAGRRTFTVSQITDARHTFFPSDFSGEGRAVEVECTTLADIIEDYRLESVHMLKLDCEGSEYDVLLSCDAETMQRVRGVVLELHESAEIGHTSAELISFLESYGFEGEVYDVQERAGLRTCMGLFVRPAA